MNIGLIIGRIGGIDGVALETEKWIHVFKQLGHEVFILSGQFEEKKIDPTYETLMAEMSFFSPESYWEQKKAFFFPETNPEELISHIEFYTNIISGKIIKWVNTNKIDLIVSENASALPAHIELGWGIRKAVKKLGIPTITHDHDFAWERGDRYISPHKRINEFVTKIFPLRLPNVFNAVINENAQNSLKEKFNRNSIVVPNVMDFSVPFGQLNGTNKSLKIDLGLSDNDILLFQITRIVRRKGIEVAINLIDKLNDKNIKLIITGNWADDEGSIYYNELFELINKLNLRSQIKFASYLINNKGLLGNGSGRNYSLSDAYANATATTYFSTYEGFGNAFVESVLAKCPIFVNNYKPVYWPDIGSKGFKTVMLEDNNLTDKAVKEMADIIYNKELNREIAEYNYDLGKKYFSFDTLREKLLELIKLATDKL
ncbi:MAG: glycosyltransferase family 4 protein [Bacteroidales bacterium]|nr:glycosyltransferase family 4 protein [Bacteroidales bacterium]